MNRLHRDTLIALGLANVLLMNCTKRLDPAFAQEAHAVLHHIVSYHEHTLFQPFVVYTLREGLDADEAAIRESLAVLRSDVDALPPGGSPERRYLSVCARATLDDLTMKLTNGFDADRAWLASDDSSRTQALEESKRADARLVENLFKLGVWERRVLGTSEVVDRIAGVEDSVATTSRMVRVKVAVQHADSVVAAEMARLP